MNYLWCRLGIFRDILIRDGNAVDAAIATVVCMGAVHPHATGFGGGLMMIVHNRYVHCGTYSAIVRWSKVFSRYWNGIKIVIE